MKRGVLVTADGCRLQFYRQGQGVAVLWQHGLGAGQEQPAAVFPEVPGIERITLMCRGHGDSDLGDPARLSIVQFTDDALALLDHLEIGQAIVGGISLGAALAQRLAAHKSQRVCGLILARPAWVDASAPPNMALYAQVADYLQRLGAARGVQRFQASESCRRLLTVSADNAHSLCSFFSRSRPETTVALLSQIAVDGPGVTPQQLQAIGVPTLIIATAEDHVHPLDDARTLNHLIASSQLKVITSKTVSPERYQQEFSSALAQFLLEQTVTGGGS